MLKAQKSKLWDTLIHHYIRNIFRKEFHTFLVAGQNHLSAFSKKMPVIGIANHSNWWDGFLILFLTRLLPARRHYIMMEERHLEKYSLFRKLGAFGVNLDDPRQGAQALHYAASLLRDPSTLLWIFPQARLRPARELLHFHRGAQLLARRVGGCLALPLALRYEFTTEQHPIALARFGPPLQDPEDINEKSVVQLLAQIDNDILKCDFSEYLQFIPPRLSLNKRWEYFWHLLHGKAGDFQASNTYRA